MYINIRETFFWLLDFISGGLIKKNFDEIKYVFENNNRESNEIIGRNLKNILSHAVQNVQFYKHFESDSLNSFPVLNKQIVRENQTSLISKDVKINTLHKVTTSGSTGAPFTVYFGKRKMKRQNADNIFFSQLGGYHLGEKLFYSRVWNSVNHKSLLQRFFQNIVMVDSSKLNIEATKELLHQIYESNRNIHLLAFSSTYEIIAKHIKENQLAPYKKGKVKSIIAMSESLTSHAKEILRNHFGVDVVMRYSNMENGFIAQEVIGQPDCYKINKASFYVEILNINNDSPVSEGEVGRIVVTDLFNYEMPLIRYDTGDLGKLGWMDGELILQSIEGRRVDYITDTKGNILSPHVITNSMWFFSSISQFQFIQKRIGFYKIIINTKAKFHEEENLIKMLCQYLGDDADIEVEYVDEIPLLQSGKRKKIINESSVF